MTAALVLIASYPKSGNTWTRLVLDHLIRRARAPISINDIETGLYVQRRMIFDRFGPVEASDLTVTEIDRYWPEVFRSLVKGQPADAPLVLKTHEAGRRTDAGAWLYPPEIVRGVIHLVRHPFDVAASYAHHRGWTIDDTIRALLDPAHRIGGDMDRLQLPMPETVGSWAGHTASWTADDLPWPVISLRYEDLRADATRGFTRAAALAGLTEDAGLIARAVGFCRFDRLQAEEGEAGFRERPAASPAFFRAGRSGIGWPDADPALLGELADRSAEMMQRFGYRADGGWEG